jgi:hypothetical protein
MNAPDISSSSPTCSTFRSRSSARPSPRSCSPLPACSARSGSTALNASIAPAHRSPSSPSQTLADTGTLGLLQADHSATRQNAHRGRWGGDRGSKQRAVHARFEGVEGVLDSAKCNGTAGEARA